MTYSSIYKTDDIEIPKGLQSDDTNHFEYLLDNTVDMIMLVNKNNEFIVVNDKLCDVLGYSKNELLGYHPDRIFTGESLEKGRCETFKLMNSQSEDATAHTRQEIETKEGDIIPVESKYTLLPRTEDGEYNGLAVISRDIRERKRREEKLQVMSRVLRHNLRTEMSVICGHAELFKSSDDPTLQEAAKTVEETAGEMLETGTKVRKIQEQIQSTPTVSYDTEITRLVDAVVDEFDEEHGHVEITVQKPDDSVRANSPRVFQTALSELVENAIEHCPKGVAASVQIEVSVEQGEVIVEVKDVCDPIPQQEIDTIDSGEETALSHASGLGLWLTNWIVETAGGKLAFSRREDGKEGNTVRIHLEKIGPDQDGVREEPEEAIK